MWRRSPWVMTPPQRAVRRSKIWLALTVPSAVLWGVAYSIGFPYMGLIPGGWMLFLVFAYKNLGWAAGYEAGMLDTLTSQERHERL